MRLALAILAVLVLGFGAWLGCRENGMLDAVAPANVAQRAPSLGPRLAQGENAELAAVAPPAEADAPSARTSAGPPELVRLPTRLSGRLVSEDGRGIAGLRALAWWSGVDPSLADVARALDERHDAIFAATSGRDGVVEFVGLDPLRDYTVTAGGPGWLAFEPRPGWRVGGDARELLVEPWFALRLDLRRADGTRYAVPRAVGGWRAEFTLADPTLGEPASVRAIEFQLAGIDDDESADPASVFLRSTADVRELGPVSIELAPPGIAPLALRDVRVPRLAAPLATLDVRVAEEQPRASVRVRFVDAAGRAALTVPAGSIELVAPDGARIEFATGAFRANPLRLDGVPHGEYAVRFVGDVFGFAIPDPESDPVACRVGAGGAELALALPPCGRIEVDVRDEGDAPFRARLVLRLAPSLGPEIEQPFGASDRDLYFARGPYEVAHVPVGTWSLTASNRDLPQTPSSSERVFETPSDPLEVRAGETARVVLRPWGR
ncbi:MAG: hypothetical protein HZA52_04360 [Planctomycetes bacterium]|nr:hypothetical protein [Planctomycetota bacterium]